jgi:hypothetical protein
VQRQQIKWFAYATVVLVGGVVLDFTISEATGVSWLGKIGFVLRMFGLAGLPMAIGIQWCSCRMHDPVIHADFCAVRNSGERALPN